jgi:hypothetical protein
MAGSRGIVTIALGHPVYHDMARDLALSLKLHAPRLPRVVLTDASGGALASLFDIELPWRPEFGHGLFPKLCIDQYSPFDETLYIDSDSLAVRDLAFLWTILATQDFGYVGQVLRDGYWYAEIAGLLDRLGLPLLPRLNSGMFLYRRGPLASDLFARTREIFLDEAGFPFDPLGRARSDEPCLGVALAERGIHPVEDHGTTMRTPIGIRGSMDIDVLAGRCVFNKDGEDVRPAIVHFATWQFHPIYYRERAKLRLFSWAQ